MQIAHKYVSNLKINLTKENDKTAECQKPKVIYSFDCRDYQKNYLGQTGERLNKRLEEHLGGI